MIRDRSAAVKRSGMMEAESGWSAASRYAGGDVVADSIAM
jgi:hypothetical protein